MSEALPVASVDLERLCGRLRSLSIDMTHGDPKAAGMLVLAAKTIESQRISISDCSTWISVSRLLPMDDGLQVLALNSLGYCACVTRIWYDHRLKLFTAEDVTAEMTTHPISDITHWMPLPKAPKS